MTITRLSLTWFARLSFMLMVIFGAGASYDSSPDFPPPAIPAGQQNLGNSPPESLSRERWRPPLANGLFDNPGHAFSDIVQRYPKLSHILPLLRRRSSGKSVEEVLEQLQGESKGNPEGQRELTSVRYYLRDLLFEVTAKWLEETDHITNYTPLIRDILRLTKDGESVCLVTFNYDLLLDNALWTYGYKPQEPEDHLRSHPVLKLFKPHGSVDWARRIRLTYDETLSRQGIIDAAGDIDLMPDFRRLNPVQADGNPSRQTFFPVIAIPLQNKTEETFAWPVEHASQLQELLPSVTKILIIGWRAREAHFIQLLMRNLPKVSRITAVGSDSADAWQTLAHFVWSTAITESIDPASVSNLLSIKMDRLPVSMPYEQVVRLSVAPGGFSDFVGNRRVIDFLKG
jgi:hypothetical protein